MMPSGKVYSADAAHILDDGVTLTELSRMFRMDLRTIKNRLQNIRPITQRDGTDVYDMRHAASQLAELPADVVARVVRLNPMDLPPMLKKEYWSGRQAQLRVLQVEGDLWQTDQVMEYIGVAFKELRMAIMLGADQIERAQVLSEPQRVAVKQIFDELLENIRGRLVTTFDERKPNKRDEDRSRTTAEICADL
jgi:hypothetical protein